MNKTKLQLYEELKKLTEISREQIKDILNDIIESGVLKRHFLNVPHYKHLCDEYNIGDIGRKYLDEHLNTFINSQISELEEYCDCHGVNIELTEIADLTTKDLFFSKSVFLIPRREDIMIDDIFYYNGCNCQEELKEFINDYLESNEAFTEYLCDNGFISADIYSDGFYELITVKELSTILTEQEEFFKNELEKLKSLQSSLYVCMYKLNQISRNFKHRFSGYLDYLGFERKH